MMLVTVLLLSALLVSDVAGFDARSRTLEKGQLETETETDQDFEKRDVARCGYCFNGRFYSGYCYQFVPQKKTWMEAERHCENLATGGHLACIDTQEKNEFIERVINEKDSSNPTTWLGLEDFNKDRAFLWTDRSAPRFTKWNKGEPNNSGGGEDCMHFNYPSEGLWNDARCDQQYPFVCSYKLNCI